MKIKVKASVLQHLSEIRCLTSFSTMEILKQAEVDKAIQNHCKFIEQTLLKYHNLSVEVEEKEMEKLWLCILTEEGALQN